ncbi:uncharacterized protein [Nicotiana tomentosiformis]|uniref:uncharacterized protein n=1 Tax=Nicotiana tomentosiformis TaxID=4098 RepID=UPI00388C57D7
MVEWELLIDTEQQLTIKVYHQEIGKYIMMTFVYVKCSSLDRLELWDNLYYLAVDMELPWVIGGNFNMVLHDDEKIGGLPVYPREVEDFAFCVNSCGLFDTGYKESPFTWWNGRSNAKYIFNRLDKIFVNQPFQTLFPNIKVVYLIRIGFDHAPLLMNCREEAQQFEPTIENKILQQQARAELKKYLSFEEQFWKQKVGMTWSAEGEDIFNMLQQFYVGASLHKSITHTNIVLLPNKPQVQTFSNLRPISLSNFINKVISREIVTDIRLRGKPANVVIKFDMANAYDRVSSKYLLRVLRKMGFAEHYIHMIWNLLANNWYSVLMNGHSTRFFKSTRGVKQGDPLSPALSILSAEVLTRSMNNLFDDKRFIGYGMPKWTDPLYHLACADDIIIFASADTYSMNKIIEDKYFKVLVQSLDFKEKAKLLSFGGKATLITSVLQSLPTHILSVLDPLNNIIEHMHKLFARFFWSTKEEGRSKHWTKWQNLCLPNEERGIGFRSLFDVSKDIPTTIQFKKGSNVWKKMLEAREGVEYEILWEINKGSTNVWHENWTGLGSLYHVVPTDFNINEDLQEVVALRDEDTWNDRF